MADQSDVSAALVTLIAATIYPNGTGQASAAGVPVRVYAGWPNPEQLDADLRAVSPVAHVSVYPRPDERNTTRYAPNWQAAAVNTATLTLTASGQTVTVAGSTAGLSTNPHNLVVLANGKPYVYAAQPGDTLTGIAAALAALIAADIAGTAGSGAVVTWVNDNGSAVSWA